MKAVMITGPGQVEVTEMPEPTPGPDEVLVRAHAVGICGSDLALYQGKRPTGYYRYPLVPGHEWSGQVAALGERVRGISVGDKVVAEGLLSCGVCDNCRNGATNLCEAGYDELGFTRPGALAEYVAVPARQIHRLPEQASLEEAALLEPTAVAAHAFLRVQLRPGAVCAIVGDGAIALLTVQLARLYNPAALIVIGLNHEKLALARQLGATHTVHIGREDPQVFIEQLSEGRGADVVLEAAGNPDAVAEAMHLARRGGQVVLEGSAGDQGMLHVPSDIFVLKHLTVQGIFGASSASWSYAVQLFRHGQLNLAPLISHRFPIEEYEQALETLRLGKALKVLMLHS